ncbi:MAG: hypothetical protein KDD51_02625 [Bdellovibrionales bacterium]|nr:hypothetical protein [Bdellovibrionales bacterium]
MGDERAIRGRIGSGAIMLSGCPLTCNSCQNYEMVQEGHRVTFEQFIEMALTLKARGAHNLQVLSPTVHFPSLRQLLPIIRKEAPNFPIIFKSSGYESVEALKRFEGLVDIYLPDLKFGSQSRWARCAGAGDYLQVAKLAIDEMFSQVGPLEVDREGIASKGLLIRHVKAPLPAAEQEELEGYLSEMGRRTQISILEHFVQLEQPPT